MSRSFSGVSIPSTGQAIPDPGPIVSPSVIPGTDIPFPPAPYGFGSTNYSGLIDAPVNAYLLVQNESGDPLVLEGQINNLLDNYKSAMAGLGWTLDREVPLTLETENGDPDNWYAASEDWTKGKQEVKISVSNYAPWLDWGYRLTLTVYGNTAVTFSS